jgi:hypothetical protein
MRHENSLRQRGRAKKIALKAVVKKATTALAHGDLADVTLNPAASNRA